MALLSFVGSFFSSSSQQIYRI